MNHIINHLNAFVTRSLGSKKLINTAKFYMENVFSIVLTTVTSSGKVSVHIKMAIIFNVEPGTLKFVGLEPEYVING